MSDSKTELPPPSSENTEKAVLGAILVKNDLIEAVNERLSVHDFYSHFHRNVFKAMLELRTAGKEIDANLIADQIRLNGEMTSPSEISEFLHVIPDLGRIDSYIGEIREQSLRRELMETCAAIRVDARKSDLSSVFCDALSRIDALHTRAEANQKITHFPQLERVIDDEVQSALDDLRHGSGRKIATGFPRLDEAIGGGLALSDVLLVAADTGSGKSAFALQLAYQIAKSGAPVAFTSGEMSSGENVLRLLSQLSGITNLNWKQHINDSEYSTLAEWMDTIRDVPLYLEHRTTDIQTVRKYLRSLVRKHEIQVLVIDYIQLFKLNGFDQRSRSERIAEASQEVKRIATELDIAIIEVAQFNREGAKSSMPGLHDLEGSGQLEKDASLILILDLDKDESQDEHGRKFRNSKVRIVKGRNVGRAEIAGRFYGSSVRFVFEQ